MSKVYDYYKNCFCIGICRQKGDSDDIHSSPLYLCNYVSVMKIANALDTVQWDLGTSTKAHLFISPCAVGKFSVKTNKTYLKEFPPTAITVNLEDLKKLITFLKDYDCLTISVDERQNSKYDILFKIEDTAILKDALIAFAQQK